MWGIARLFAEGFQFIVSRLVQWGKGLFEVQQKFRETFPHQPMPHPNTLNALINRARISNSVSERINKKVKPRKASYPQVPAGYPCEGFIYRVIVPVIVPVYGSPGAYKTVDMPVEIQSPVNLSYFEIEELVPGAIEAMQGTKDTYELLRLGIASETMEIGAIRITDAYRC